MGVSDGPRLSLDMPNAAIFVLLYTNRSLLQARPRVCLERLSDRFGHEKCVILRKLCKRFTAGQSSNAMFSADFRRNHAKLLNALSSFDARRRSFKWLLTNCGAGLLRAT